ncbi:terminase large subunit [Aureimonas frigidaquae]|uniref:Phage terminase-like protein n=1 Tax=Aureimonas frigidaquae TaxID=424757 RepID=A0A0P0Z3P1_9HYPH|nr:terminase TerL endonuclease subunit [Aureimonas frigidaquae]BAT28735.1 phage terminase-like protein [Aureimonas frigidaquae]
MSLPTWIFDGSEIDDPFGYGQRAVDFLRILRHPKSRLAGRAFELPEWQERIVRRIYGPCHSNGRRIVRNVIILLPRGNRKTSLGAALGLLHTIGPERLNGGQANIAAADRKQARIAYEEAVGIVRADKRIASKMGFQSYKNRLSHPKSGAVLEALSADAGTQHGRTPTFALVDELHAWKKRELWDVIRTGLVKVPGSLLVVITTAGRGQENIAFDTIDYARKVARGEIDDPATLPILFETPADANWRDEEVWHRVNPGLANGFPDIEGLRQLAREAENKPADREAFRQLHLNVWLDHSADPFVEMAIYDEGAEAIDEADLENEPCWIAVDASLTTDLTAIVASFPDGDDSHRVMAWFFVPEENLRARADRDGVPYPRWAEEGRIIPTPGNVIDYRAVEQFIRELCVRFEVREIAFDPAYARQISVPLAEDGYPVVEMRQGWRTMAPAIAELERVIIGRRFRHDGNPVLRWCFDNVAVEIDKAGNKSFHKGKSKDRIDGAVAAAMAVARATEGDSGRSVYADADARPEGLLVF